MKIELPWTHPGSKTIKHALTGCLQTTWTGAFVDEGTLHIARTGRPPKILGEDSSHLVALIESDRTATLDEIRLEFKRRTGVDVHAQTIINTLGKLGIRRVPKDEAVALKQAEPAPRRYGYTAAHRRHEAKPNHPSCRTDAEWARVRDLFENPDRRGVPPKLSR